MGEEPPLAVVADAEERIEPHRVVALLDLKRFVQVRRQGVPRQEEMGLVGEVGGRRRRQLQPEPFGDVPLLAPVHAPLQRDADIAQFELVFQGRSREEGLGRSGLALQGNAASTDHRPPKKVFSKPGRSGRRTRASTLAVGNRRWDGHARVRSVSPGSRPTHGVEMPVIEEHPVLRHEDPFSAQLIMP